VDEAYPLGPSFRHGGQISTRKWSQIWSEKKPERKKKNPPKFGLNVDECISPKFKVGENAPKLTRQIHLTNQCGLRVIMSMVNNEKAKVYSGRSG
jgi:hypothetical protein